MEGEHSLPLAPPAAFANLQPQQRRAVPQTPLSNSDFRKLLSTPRPERAPVAKTPAGRAATGAAGSQRDKTLHRPKPKPVVDALSAGAAADDAPSAYRDRAAERRDDANPDYAGLPGGASVGGMHASGFAVGGAMPGAATADALSIEESKFLGGDVEHTHLVKGLDFALLQKVRAQQAARESEEARERADAQRAAASLDTPVFHTSVGRAVYTFATRKHGSSSRAAERFALNRLAFVFELEPVVGAGARGSAELPTTLLRSAADLPDAPETATAAVDAALLQRISGVMTHMRLGDIRGKKVRRRADSSVTGSQTASRDAKAGPETASAGRPVGSAELATPAAAAADDDEDIFADAGRAYVCEPAKKSHSAAAAECTAQQAPEFRQTSYFGDGGTAALPSVLPAAVLTAGAATAGIVPPGDASVVDVYSSIEAAEHDGAETAAAAAAASAAAERLRKLQELDSDAAYGDLYPGYGGYGFDADGSDDDGAPDGKPAGRKSAKGLSADADPAVNANKTRDAKLSAQLQDVRRTLVERHGDKYEGAFAKRERGGEARPQPGESDAVDDKVKARAKRVRL